MEILEQTLCLLAVALLWGVTNTLMKRGSSGVEAVGTGGALSGLLKEIVFLVREWRYTIPFLVNQLGSVLFYWTVAHSELSLVAPVANSLTLVVTTVSGRLLLREDPLPPKTYIGMALTLTGITLCVWSKIE